jgi:hypothetical protein
MMKRWAISLVATAAWCTVVLGNAEASSIGVYFDQQATTFCAEQHPVTQGTAYILAALYGNPFVFGIVGAEFRVDGMPASWSATVVPRPGATTLGNPLTGGCNIAFPCQMSPIVLLYTVHYTVLSELTVHLSVHAHSSPSNLTFTCPILYCACDQPGECVACVPGGTAAINDPSFCLVGVAPSTWSRVKSLYER